MFISLSPSSLRLFHGGFEGWTICFQMPPTAPYASFSAGCTLVLEKTLKLTTKAMSEDLKIAAYTCRLTFSSMVTVGSSDCTKCHTEDAGSTKPIKHF